MQQIKEVVGTGIPLLLDDIDTDRIIPARFLRCVTFEGLGEHAFEDDRAQDSDHPFNQSQYSGASILIAGRNFGCGSSREHAPQSLMRWGIRAVVAESFAEIFFGNCNSLGIAAVRAAREDLQALSALVHASPGTEIRLDLQTLSIRAGEFNATVEMPDSVRSSLTEGTWDFLGQLLSAQDEIKECAAAVPYISGFGS